MYTRFYKRLKALSQNRNLRLREGLKGLEKESLRVTADGSYAHTRHPVALGSSLTHPYITTDYSEALLEFVTPPSSDVQHAERFLFDAHVFTCQHLDDEILWATSMPCVVQGDESIPIARYGTSNAGQMKHIYRHGLGLRYGRVMQVIAGVHFNYSLPAHFWPLYQTMEGDNGDLRLFRDMVCFGQIRNLQRFGWLVLYLFGNSPALCKSFIGADSKQFSEFDANSFYEPYATSLRMSDIGYRNKTPALNICYKSLDTYVSSLKRAIEMPYPPYEALGIKKNGKYQQLNTNLLQIENEYYSTVRPKQVPNFNEKPVNALQARGVAYVELRSLDVDAFEPVGVNQQRLRFLEAFLIFCLLHDSPPASADERKSIDNNQLQVAIRGREPGLQLQYPDHSESLKNRALEICDAMQGICELLDDGLPDRPYAQALAEQRAAVNDPDLTPSARMLATMRERQETFYAFAMHMSEHHAQYFAQQTLPAQTTAHFEQWAAESLQKQADLEAADTETLEEFLRAYFEQT